MAEDDAAQAEIDQWLQEQRKSSEQAAAMSETTLKPRIRQRFDQVRRSYETFLQLHPRHVNARVAFASFLSDTGDEEAGAKELEKAKEIDPSNAAVWNNLGNYYGHNGGASNALVCYTKAIALSPKESVYYQNLAINTYMFRREAQEFFGMTEPQIFNKVMALYRKALALDPENFQLATELAQTYYGIKPPPETDPVAARRAEQKHYDEALEAWRVALQLAGDDVEREGVYIHLARVNIAARRLEEARRHLNLVTNSMYAGVKDRLERNMVRKETNLLSASLKAPVSPTNLPAATPALAVRPTLPRSVPTDASAPSTNILSVPPVQLRGVGK